MAAYFVISVLVIILFPITLSSLSSISSSEHISYVFSLDLISRRAPRAGQRVPVYSLCPAQSRGEETPTWFPAQTQVYQKVRHSLDSEFHSRSQRSLLIIVGWASVTFLSYKVAHAELENKVYNPFEILGISTVRLIPRTPCLLVPHTMQGATEKEIKSHFKKLSRV